MSTTFHELSDPLFETPQTSGPHQTRVETPDQWVIEDPLFSSHEVDRFRKEDAEAGRTICTIMSTLFTISVILALVVLAWTLTRGL